MKAYVITLMDLPESVELARRCIDSGRKHGVDVEMFRAITPTHPTFMLNAVEDRSAFDVHAFSRPDPCFATFLSHSSLWSKCFIRRTPTLILEHDAVFVAPLPDLSRVLGVCNLGRPSFGQFIEPPDGFGPFRSKTGGYFGGAHGYYVHPDGARRLMARVADEAEPTDLYLNTKRFPWLTEYHPWPIVADDTFSTIQLDRGCRAKHNAVTPLVPEWEE